jgi:hypothetical protein
VKSDHLPDATVTGQHIRVKLLNVSTSLWCRRAVFVSVELRVFNLVGEIRQIIVYFYVFHFGDKKDIQACKYSIKIGNCKV